MTTPAAHRRIVYALTLGLLAAMGPLCIDLYLPSLPALAADLNTPTASAQPSLTAGMVGLRMGQLLFGTLSDKYGRLRPLLLSVILLLIATVACAAAQTIHQFLAARLFEGLASAGGSVLARAIARDMYNGHELTKFFALLMLVNGLAPVFAPVLGGVLLTFLNWRGLFIALAIIAALQLLIARINLHETLPVERRNQGSLLHAWGTLGKVIRHRGFMSFCLPQGFMMASMFAYIGASPFVLQQIYGLSPQAFSLCFASNGIGLILASQTSVRLSQVWGEYQVLRGGLSLAIVASGSLIGCALLSAPLWGVLLALFFSVACTGIITVTAGSLAMQSQGERAGSASAIIGVTAFTLGGASVPVTGLGGTSLISMAATIFGCCLLATMLFHLLARKPQPQSV
ncbi:Bcr/CflA family drug resistance efflux transporter [Erwinia sp. OLTSP20]|uniref:multidrug effflux MFS transporter n=1 Tax=unclassified Erwinia TaxID=2622719 RepID=UPI000C19226D|nr:MULTISPECIES: multidrug effflux MFS transporter [unclassified Erwinia]PIJ51860.1 MFS transporter [Erwinia sp. OAMSP11]PIJ74448.1 Bcr/CflA family drug resistance efflux transporter [Erwinia sp. OLSSP12]PIJ83719.1 Bcr/CflA family drug resistance efflux transporter [Erwinia sp. OLCASP19]PIJ86762.1 Bcr/CflA family drug resistance efflux transporter [Erwinia sp. OLMTSP26]PIJ88169.1 Bcr/CflA family drug resistance efflux transporter [Erwinia sp. OLMDSP33]